MRNLLAEVSLSGLFHLDQDHGRNFLGTLASEDVSHIVRRTKAVETHEIAHLATGFNLYSRLPALINDFERPRTT